MKHPYSYSNVKVVRVVDGDTVELAIDVGFRMTYQDNCRLMRINAAERYTEAGPAAIAYLTGLLAGGIARVDTIKKDKYGRWLVELYVPVEGGLMNVSDAMLINGFAVPYMV